MNKKLIKVDRNGTKYFAVDSPCQRCGGAGGADKWAYTGWKCYECGGSGQGRTEIIKEYTPEYEAKLEERRAKRRAKWEAEHAEEIAKREAERKAKEEERRRAEEEAEKARQEEEARKAKSQFVGTVGDKVELKVTFEKTAWFEIRSFAGFGTETMYIHTFRTEEGNAIVWKTTSNCLGDWDEEGNWIQTEAGQELTIKGIIKEHSEYRNEKQTVLTRCRIKK